MNGEQDKETILSVVVDPDLGLCVEFGDERVDNEVYGYRPTHDFVRAVAEEIEFQVGNTLAEHPTLERVQRRFQARAGAGKGYERIQGKSGSKL